MLAFNYRHLKPPFFNENASDYSYEENCGFTLNTHILWKNKKSVDKNNSVNDMQSLLSLWFKTELGTTPVEEVENFYRQLVPSFHRVFKNFSSKYYKAHLYKQNDTKRSKIQQIFAE